MDVVNEGLSQRGGAVELIQQPDVKIAVHHQRVGAVLVKTQVFYYFRPVELIAGGLQDERRIQIEGFSGQLGFVGHKIGLIPQIAGPFISSGSVTVQVIIAHGDVAVVLLHGVKHDRQKVLVQVVVAVYNMDIASFGYA